MRAVRKPGKVPQKSRPTRAAHKDEVTRGAQLAWWLTAEKENGTKDAPDVAAILKQSLAGHAGQRPKHSRSRNGHAAHQPHGIRTHFAERARR